MHIHKGTEWPWSVSRSLQTSPSFSCWHLTNFAKLSAGKPPSHSTLLCLLSNLLYGLPSHVAGWTSRVTAGLGQGVRLASGMVLLPPSGLLPLSNYSLCCPSGLCCNYANPETQNFRSEMPCNAFYDTRIHFHLYYYLFLFLTLSLLPLLVLLLVLDLFLLAGILLIGILEGSCLFSGWPQEQSDGQQLHRSRAGR